MSNMILQSTLAAARNEKKLTFEVDTSTADGVFVKQITIPYEDTLVPQHSHLWDHTTLLAHGSMFVWKDGTLDKQYRAPAMLLIKAGVKHKFYTLTDNVVLYCIHNLHNKNVVDILEEHHLSPEDIEEVS